MLVHVIDVSEASGRPDPVKDFEVIMGELASFGAGLEEKPMIVVANKIDAMQAASSPETIGGTATVKSRDVARYVSRKPSKSRARARKRPTASRRRKATQPETKLTVLTAYCKKRKLELYPISAVTGEGVEKLKFAIGAHVRKLREREAKAQTETPLAV
jgi:GTP-binding protein